MSSHSVTKDWGACHIGVVSSTTTKKGEEKGRKKRRKRGEEREPCELNLVPFLTPEKKKAIQK